MKKMRIVGLNPNTNIFVQRLNGAKWDQEILNMDEFESVMRNEFPMYWSEYEKSGSSKSAGDFFYNYGETELMRRKGDAYIYTA